MNKKQRNRNRENARKLTLNIKQKRLSQHTCEQCGQKGGHWVTIQPTSLQGIINGQNDQIGFWTCLQTV